MLSRTKLVAALTVGLITATSAFAGAIIPIDNAQRAGIWTPYNIGFGMNLSGSTFYEIEIQFSGWITVCNSEGDGWQAFCKPGGWINPLYNPAHGGDEITYGYIDYDEHNAFAINWVVDDWGALRYNNQLVLVDRSDISAGDFDFIFNFDSVQWNGLPYVMLGYCIDDCHGYHAGYGYYGYTASTFPYGVNQLPYNSINSDVAGRYVFEVRNGVVINPLPLLVPEPETWTMLLSGLGIVGAVARRQRARAVT